MTESEKEKTYRALTGLNYYDQEKKDYVRVEVGGKITGMSKRGVRNELAAGNIELWEEEGGKEDG